MSIATISNDSWLEHKRDVRGQVLEFADDSYARRFGGAHVSGVDVLHLRADNPRATIVADLPEATLSPPLRLTASFAHKSSSTSTTFTAASGPCIAYSSPAVSCSWTCPASRRSTARAGLQIVLLANGALNDGYSSRAPCALESQPEKMGDHLYFVRP